jgi:hypothetical protein
VHTSIVPLHFRSTLLIQLSAYSSTACAVATHTTAFLCSLTASYTPVCTVADSLTVHCCCALLLYSLLLLLYTLLLQIISNPVTYSHIHCAEALSAPLHLFFPQPWVPTQEFPHPFASMSYEKGWSAENWYRSVLTTSTTTW